MLKTKLFYHQVTEACLFWKSDLTFVFHSGFCVEYPIVLTLETEMNLTFLLWFFLENRHPSF